MKQPEAAIILAALQDEAKPLFKQLQKISVTDNDSLNLKAAKLDALKTLGKLAAEKEKSLTDPLTKVIKDVRALFAPFRTLVADAEEITKLEITEHIKLMKAKQEKVKDDVGTGKIAKVSTGVRKLAELEVHSSVAQIRKTWVAVEIDASVTPREYLVPDRAKIKEALKAGKKVLGWEYKQEIGIAI